MGFSTVLASYQDGWHQYLESLDAPLERRSASPRLQTAYDVSVMTLAAHEEKTYRGAYIASPSMPWVWGSRPR